MATTGVPPALEDALRKSLAAHVSERESVLTAFLAAEQARLARVCFEMARAFSRGGTLIAFGCGSAATDAAHLGVEFMHPVIVGKRALPALALSNDPTGASRLASLARSDDIAVGLSHSHADPAVEGFLSRAASRGLLTIAFGGGASSRQREHLGRSSDHALIVPSGDPLVVQEVQETAYHIIWELVHVFFEHPGLLDDACITCGDVAVPANVVALADRRAVIEKDGAREEIAVDLVDDVAIGDLLLCHAGVALQKLPAGESADRPPDGGVAEPTNFLYPFLDSEEVDLESVLADVQASTLQKGSDVSALRATIDLDVVARCGAAMRERLDRGGRLISFGNGGSSTDAQDLAADCLYCGWPAIALTNDPATVTAVANDVGFDKVFARQLIALGRSQDIAVGISTSGSSANVVAGLEEANRCEMLTCGIAGYDGGRLAELPWLDFLVIVRNDYIPRLQEAQATVYHLLLEAALGER
jgi:D-sedoheptulose 7-phosphate isomerase